MCDTEHGKTDKERIKELEKMIELEKAKKLWLLGTLCCLLL